MPPSNPINPDDLVMIPLGGCEQFGLNFNLYGYDNKWLAVDCGIGFADERWPGVDLLLPDTSFIEERRGQLLGLVITHAHEDHVGAVPYIWPRLKCPIYCPPFVATFLRRKCAEFPDVKGMVIHEIMPDQIFNLGPFQCRAIGVTHSTPSTISLAIDTPKGLVVHGNEWNLDPTPATGPLTNREGFKIAGRSGVLAYVGDSTNAPYSGRSIGEDVVQKGLEAAFATCTGRICVTMFASNIGRIISIARAAKKVGRSVCLAGRSMLNYVAVAGEHHLIRDIPPFIDTKQAASLPPSRVVYVVTGSQGESRAALARIASGEYRDIKLHRGDTVIFSARAIPQNERRLNWLKGDLLASGIRVLDADNTPNIHATGHPYREEIAEMLDWVRPHILIPIQGERFHLEAQVDLARQKQIPHAIVPNNGSIIRLDRDDPGIVGTIETGILAVEPSRVMASNHPAMQERRALHTTGVVQASVVVDPTGGLVAPVQVSALGLFDPEDPDDMKVVARIEKALTRECHRLADESDPWDAGHAREALRLTARRVVMDDLGLKPKVMVHVLVVGN